MTDKSETAQLHLPCRTSRDRTHRLKALCDRSETAVDNHSFRLECGQSFLAFVSRELLPEALSPLNITSSKPA